MDVVNDIIEILKDDKNISWQSLIYEIVKKEGMDPWDIDISTLAKRFLEISSKMKSFDFYLSGKIVLSASILLKYKAENLAESDFDIFQEEENFSEGMDFLEEPFDDFQDTVVPLDEIKKNQKMKLKTPLRVNRKVSLFDLVNTLDRAMKVYKRKVVRHKKTKKAKKVDKRLQSIVDNKYPEMSFLLDQVYHKIQNMPEDNVKFSKLVGSEDKMDTIYTFIPLLQMRNNDVVDLHQKTHFTDFDVEVKKRVL